MHADHICCRFRCNKESLIANLSPSWQDREQQAFTPGHRAGTKLLPRFPLTEWREKENALVDGKVLLQEAKSITIFDSLQAVDVYHIQLSHI